MKLEKSEIINSLKVLLIKKEQIKHDNDLTNNLDIDNNKNLNNNYKTINNDNKKKILVNKIKTDDLNRIIINENLNRRIRRKNINFNNEDDNISHNININNNDNLNDQFQKIYVKKSQDFLQKGDIFIRNKYKNKKNETTNI